MGVKGSSSAKKTKKEKKEVRSCVRFLLSPSLFTGFDMSTTTTTTPYSFLSLSLLGGFSIFKRNLLSLFVFRLFASFVDLYCRSRPRNEIQKTFFLSILLATFDGRRLSLSEKKNKRNQNNQKK
jgi:hypothetical protein